MTQVLPNKRPKGTLFPHSPNDSSLLHTHVHSRPKHPKPGSFLTVGGEIEALAAQRGSIGPKSVGSPKKGEGLGCSVRIRSSDSTQRCYFPTTQVGRTPLLPLSYTSLPHGSPKLRTCRAPRWYPSLPQCARGVRTSADPSSVHPGAEGRHHS